MTDLSPAETSRFRELEQKIGKGLGAFLDVVDAFVEIQKSRFYRDTHASFEVYCRERWDLTDRRVRQMIASAETMRQIGQESSKDGVNSGTVVPVSIPERQVRPLSRLPKSDRPSAYREAVETAPNGKPTAKHVETVVARRLAQSPTAGSREPGEDDDRDDDGSRGGLSRVNGTLAPDPPDVAKARRDGVIDPAIVVEVSEPGEAPSATAVDPGPEPATPAQTDKEWLESLPARDNVSETRRRWFDADALLYRQLEAARELFRKSAVRPLAACDRRGGRDSAFRSSVRSFLRIEPPSKWRICVGPENGGCGGTGENPIGQCPKCHGKGYTIR